jgi:hypothetical protein
MLEWPLSVMTMYGGFQRDKYYIIFVRQVSGLIRSRLSVRQYENYQHYIEDAETVFRLTVVLGRRLARVFNASLTIKIDNDHRPSHECRLPFSSSKVMNTMCCWLSPAAFVDCFQVIVIKSMHLFQYCFRGWLSVTGASCIKENSRALGKTD